MQMHCSIPFFFFRNLVYKWFFFFCLQDVICGILISAVLLGGTYPYWETMDHFQLNNPISPIVVLVLFYFLCYIYPELDHYSTTRGDTTTILGTCAGASAGYWVNQQLGQTFEPEGMLPVPLPTLTASALALGTGRFLVGAVILLATRQIVKTVSLHMLYSWYKVLKSDNNARRRKEIEVPSKFATYTSVGLVNSILANRIFLFLGLLWPDWSIWSEQNRTSYLSQCS